MKGNVFMKNEKMIAKEKRNMNAQGLMIQEDKFLK